MDIKYVFVISCLCLGCVCGVDEEVVVGSTAKLPCTAEGHFGTDYDTVVWQDPVGGMLSQNDRIMTNDDRFSIDREYTNEWNLLIDDVKTSDAGTYKCIINSLNEEYPQQQQHVTLHVTVPPSIKNTTGDTSVQEGHDVSMTCNADGTPQPTITWYYFEPSGDKILLDEGSNTYTVLAAEQSDAGVYECVADNDVPPPASARIKLDVTFIPILLLPHTVISQSVGQDTLLNCIVTANPLTTHIWLKDGQQVENSDRMVIKSWRVDDYTQRLDLFIVPVQQEDFGDYTCAAENMYGHTNATMQLYELNTGTFRATSTPDNSIVQLHSNARFNCTVEGMGSRDNLIWWHHYLATDTYVKLYESNPSSQRLGSRDVNKYKNTDKIEVIGNYDMIIKDVTMQDSGVYICELVSLQNYTAHLTVVDTLICGGNLTDVLEGDRANLSCSMNYTGAYTPWDVTWVHDEIKLSSIDYDQPGSLQRLVSFRTWNTDSGKYTCTVDSSATMTSQSCNAYLAVSVDDDDEVTAASVEEPPPIVTAGVSTMGVALGTVLVVMAIFFIIILVLVIKYYRFEIRKLRPTARVVSARYKNGSVSVEQERPLTERMDSNQDSGEV